MNNMELSLNRIILTLSIAMILMSVVVTPSLPKDSAEYVISVLNIIINAALLSFIFIRIKIKKSKEKK